MSNRRIASKQMITRARQLRRDSTAPEQLLWSVLRRRTLGGAKFRRQEPIGPYVADFCCREKKLVIEWDGESHEGRQKQDAARTRYSHAAGYREMRFVNDDVMSN